MGQRKDKTLPKIWRKYKYITNKEIEKLEYLIYNNIKIKQEDIEIKSKFDKKFLKNFNNKWVRLSEPMDHFVLLDNGKLFNTNSKRYTKPIFTESGIVYTTSGGYVDVEYIFEHMAWEFDYDKFKQEHNDKGWPYFFHPERQTMYSRGKISRNMIDIYE